MVSEIVEDSSRRDPLLGIDSLDATSGVNSDEYVELQVRIFRLTFLLTVFAVGIAGFFWGIQAGASLFFRGIVWGSLLSLACTRGWKTR